MKLLLRRDLDDGACTLGTLTLGFEIFQTIERPWISAPIGQGGAKGVSCVPKGLYKLVLHDSEAHPRTWALVNPELDVYHLPTDAPLAQRQYARTAVLLHPANWPYELRGCIAPGMKRQQSEKGWMVTQSRIAWQRIQTGLPWEEHQLSIE